MNDDRNQKLAERQEFRMFAALAVAGIRASMPNAHADYQAVAEKAVSQTKALLKELERVNR